MTPWALPPPIAMFPWGWGNGGDRPGRPWNHRGRGEGHQLPPFLFSGLLHLPWSRKR